MATFSCALRGLPPLSKIRQDRLSAAVTALAAFGHHAAPEGSTPAAAEVVPRRGREVAVEVVPMLKEGAVVCLPRVAGVPGIGGIVGDWWCPALALLGGDATRSLRAIAQRPPHQWRRR